jgi:hypothetical protein
MKASSEGLNPELYAPVVLSYVRFEEMSSESGGSDVGSGSSAVVA